MVLKSIQRNIAHALHVMSSRSLIFFIKHDFVVLFLTVQNHLRLSTTPRQHNTLNLLIY